MVRSATRVLSEGVAGPRPLPSAPWQAAQYCLNIVLPEGTYPVGRCDLSSPGPGFSWGRSSEGKTQKTEKNSESHGSSWWFRSSGEPIGAEVFSSVGATNHPNYSRLRTKCGCPPKCRLPSPLVSSDLTFRCAIGAIGRRAQQRTSRFPIR